MWLTLRLGDFSIEKVIAEDRVGLGSGSWTRLMSVTLLFYELSLLTQCVLREASLVKVDFEH